MDYSYSVLGQPLVGPRLRGVLGISFTLMGVADLAMQIPVWEFQFGVDLKEHVMRRRHDDWINATHILKAAGFDKPARTRILEREVQKDVHEKIQGGYGKYQGRTAYLPLPWQDERN